MPQLGIAKRLVGLQEPAVPLFSISIEPEIPDPLVLECENQFDVVFRISALDARRGDRGHAGLTGVRQENGQGRAEAYMEGNIRGQSIQSFLPG